MASCEAKQIHIQREDEERGSLAIGAFGFNVKRSFTTKRCSFFLGAGEIPLLFGMDGIRGWDVIHAKCVMGGGLLKNYAPSLV